MSFIDYSCHSEVSHWKVSAKKEKKTEIALFDSLQPLILTIKGLSAEETCVVPEGHSYRKCAPVISRPRHQTIRRN